MLDRVRARKVSLLRDNPDVLRKSDTGAGRSSAEPRWFGLSRAGRAARPRGAPIRRAALRRSGDRLSRTSIMVRPAVCRARGPGDGQAARDRQSEEQRLAKASGRNMPGKPDGALRQALRRPIVGNRGLIDFLTRRAGR